MKPNRVDLPQLRQRGRFEVREWVWLPYRPKAEIILAMCQEVDRDIEGVSPGSPQAAALQSEAAQLRHKYQCLVHAPHFTNRPEPSLYSESAATRRSLELRAGTG